MLHTIANFVPRVYRLVLSIVPLALAAVLVQSPVPIHASPPTIGLTKIGNPIWKPTDFQLFTAPAAPFPDAFLHTIDLVLPLEGPGVASYTPHAGPYDHELSDNAAAAGFVNQQVFPKSAITLDPNGVYFMIMLLPDPGVTGSSRDFASGPIIPNSLFPFSTHAEMWLNGSMVETLQDGMYNPRAGDLPFDGASHRAPSQAVWWPWANDPDAGPTGFHDLRWNLRDNQGNGWDMSAQFTVIPEPSTITMSAAALGVGITIAIARRNRKCIKT